MNRADAGPGGSLSRELAEADLPVLILHGEHDMVLPPEVARRLHAAVPGAELAIVAQAGHMAHFDSPGAWLGAIRAFLTRRQALA